MKQVAKPLMVALVGGLMAISFCPATAFAQRGRSGAGGGRGRAGGEIQMDEQTVIDVSTDILHLSDAQKQQVKSIFDAAAKVALPITVQMESSEETLYDAVKAGKTDDQIKSIAAQQGALRGQILQLQAQAFAKMWALLTPEQKSEAGILIYNGIGQFLSNPHPPAATNLPNIPAAASPGASPSSVPSTPPSATKP